MKEKPSAIVKEPTYTGKVQYATFALGNGPKSHYYLAVDEPEAGIWRKYIDKNQNGDLSDDGDGAWEKKAVQGARVVYGVNEYTLRASF